MLKTDQEVTFWNAENLSQDEVITESSQLINNNPNHLYEWRPFSAEGQKYSPPIQ